jgi:hypothetical protein
MHRCGRPCRGQGQGCVTRGRQTAQPLWACGSALAALAPAAPPWLRPVTHLPARQHTGAPPASPCTHGTLALLTLALWHLSSRAQASVRPHVATRPASSHSPPPPVALPHLSRSGLRMLPARACPGWPKARPPGNRSRYRARWRSLRLRRATSSPRRQRSSMISMRQA